MNFIKSLIFYDYLYSPQSLLHKQNNKLKIYIYFIQLLFLPYISLKYLTIFFIILSILYKFIYIPANLKNYLCKITLFFIIFLIISIEKKNIISCNLNNNRKVLLIYPLKITNFYTDNFYLSFNRIPLFSFYLPISIIRLLSINFLYLIILKLLLLTTHYHQIIKIILAHLKKYTNFSTKILKLELLISSQFLNIICYQIEIIKTIYITRNIRLCIKYNLKENLYMYFYFVQKLLSSIYENIDYISHTLYGREIKYQNLKFYN